MSRTNLHLLTPDELIDLFEEESVNNADYSFSTEAFKAVREELLERLTT